MGFLQKLFAATPENPRFSLNDPAAWDALGAVPSSAGVQVNEETALTHSPWWRGITLLANDVAKLPLCVLSVTGGTDKKPAKKHPAYQLLRWKANEFQTAGVWKKQMMGHALSRGNGYSYILRNGAGDPQELLPLNPYDTYPVRENGKLWYVTRVVNNQIPGGGEDRKLAAEDIFHLKGFGFDGLIGYSVIDKAREVLGLGMGERKYQAIYFRNNARPSIVLLHPGVLGDKTKDELRQSWERMQSGLENAHRTAVLDRGLTVKDLSFNSADSEIIASRQFDLIDIANFVGVPPHKLGANIATSYGSLEQENQSYLDSGLDPWLCALEEEARDKLLTEGEKDGDTVEVGFDRGKLIRANLTDRTNYYRTALGGQPWMTQEEVRLEEGMNPEPDVGEIKAPLNMGPPGGPPHPGAPPAPGNGDQPPGAPPVPPGKRPPGKPPVAPPAPPKKPKKKAARKQARLEAHAALLADAVRRNVVRVGHRAERAAVDPAKFLAWVDGLRAEQFGLALDSLAPVERVVFIAGEHQGQAVAPWLLGELHSEYSALADRATAKQLVGECAALAADQAVRLSAVAARKFLAYSDDQPRDDHGRFGGGGGAGDKGEVKSGEASAHSTLARIGDATKDALVKAGATVSHLEHAAKEWVAEKAAAIVAKLPPRWQAVAKGAWKLTRVGGSIAFATHMAGQAMAEAVARERGMGAAQAKAFRGVLSTIDTAATKPIALGMELTGLGHLAFPASLIPVASTGYLAYSAARHPLATIRAARNAVRAAGKKMGLHAAVGMPAYFAAASGPINDVADRLKAREGDALDWYTALLAAALDETGDVAAAVKLADAAAESTPTEADAPAGADPFFDELDDEDKGSPSAVAGGRSDFFAYSPDQPRDDHGRFGTGDDEKEGEGKPSKKEHEDKAKGKFAESLRGDKQLSNGKRREYYKAASEVHEAMPARALERYNANTAGHRFHEDAAALTEALKRDVPTLQLAAGTMAGGAYRPKSKTLELDGGMDEMRQSTREVYAHEMTHAVDGPGHELSGSGGWREAYQQEIAGGKLSAYAKKSPAEGFAEFGRAVYGGKANKGAIEAHFPKSAKFFKDQGIW